MVTGCDNETEKTIQKTIEIPFEWDAATIYFMLVDRFNNGDTSNDENFNRDKKAALLRGFEGGDIKGVTQKVESGYFTDLGVNAIWMTPIVEQIHGGTNEGTGLSYGFHGYWTKDWTNLDPDFGTKDDLRKLVAAAHKKGIRIVLDAVINHRGPVTDKDPVWPQSWVRTGPACDYHNFDSTVSCTLVANLPDIRTESNETVEIPPQLVEKWKLEGRYKKEIAELDAFFEKTGYPRAPRFYIMKWLADYITEFGIDGYRVDTVKHTEPYVWREFRKVVDVAFAEYKANNPEKVLDNNGFYLVGEVYNYAISNEKAFDFGDRKVNYFDKAFNQLINFEFKWNAEQMDYESIFSKYDNIIHNDLKDYSVLNYLSSHDDNQPFDAMREKPFETATKLLLTPGAAQIYYGDESARVLHAEGAVGDANLRTFMNWDDIKSNLTTQAILIHWRILGQFRVRHPAVGAGRHKMISQSPYVFSRTYVNGNFKDNVVIGLDLEKGKKRIPVSGVFIDGMQVFDAYSNIKYTVENGNVVLQNEYSIVLLEQFKASH